jgi:hypothetical protein
MDAPFQPELLLQHGRFVRLLAYHLLRDAPSPPTSPSAPRVWMPIFLRPSTGGSYAPPSWSHPTAR